MSLYFAGGFCRERLARRTHIGIVRSNRVDHAGADGAKFAQNDLRPRNVRFRSGAAEGGYSAGSLFSRILWELRSAETPSGSASRRTVTVPG